jgi:hypothetical protein
VALSGILDRGALKYFVILEGINNITVQYMAFVDATKCSAVNSFDSCYCDPKFLAFNNTDIST